jgi:hypothetical protein
MIKVTPELNKETGISRFTFECSTEADLEAMDHVRVAFLGQFPKRGSYENSKTLVIEAKVPVVELS